MYHIYSLCYSFLHYINCITSKSDHVERVIIKCPRVIRAVIRWIEILPQKMGEERELLSFIEVRLDFTNHTEMGEGKGVTLLYRGKIRLDFTHHTGNGGRKGVTLLYRGTFRLY